MGTQTQLPIFSDGLFNEWTQPHYNYPKKFGNDKDKLKQMGTTPKTPSTSAFTTNNFSNTEYRALTRTL